MRLMLTTTHEALQKSLRDVHAAELKTLETERRYLEDKVKSLGSRNQLLAERINSLDALVKSQQSTIDRAMSDLVILKGAGRVRREIEPPIERPTLDPDVDVTDEIGDLDKRNDLIAEARRTYDELVKEIDVSQVKPEVLKAAIPESEEAWKREHTPIINHDDAALAFLGD